MKTSSADILEYGALKELIGRYLTSPLGRRELDGAEPSSDRPRLEEILAGVQESITYLRQATHPQTAARGAALRITFNTVPDLTSSVHKLRIEGATLEPSEIVDVIAL